MDEKHMLEHHRTSDEPFITVSRTIPIWALLTAIVAIVATGVTLQLGQSDQAKKTQELSAQVTLLNANYNAEIGNKIKMQLMIESLQQRVAALESKK